MLVNKEPEFPFSSTKAFIGTTFANKSDQFNSENVLHSIIATPLWFDSPIFFQNCMQINRSMTVVGRQAALHNWKIIRGKNLKNKSCQEVMKHR